MPSVILSPGQDKSISPVDTGLSESPALLATDLFAEAGRKVVLFHLQSMKRHEFAAMEGSDIEGVHQMRVSTRRLRSAYSIFRSAFPDVYERTVYKPIRRTANALGAVRDMDVLLSKLGQYTGGSVDVASEMKRLFTALRSKRQKSRRSLLLWLDSPRYGRFQHEAFELLSQPLSPSTLPKGSSYTTIGSMVPSIVYKRIADVQDVPVLAGTLHPEEYHNLRIRCKRLRYTLESFSALLGDGHLQMVAALKNIQDLLGEMNDATVMLGYIDTIERHYTAPESGAWNAYKALLASESERVARVLPAQWKLLFSRKNKKALAKAIGDL